MAKQKVNFDFDLGALEADLQKYARDICRYAASEIADELTESTVFAIGAFYSDYTPGFRAKSPANAYKRHYYNFMNKSYRRYYSNPHNTIFRGGVEFTPGLMDDIYPSYTTDEVFGSVVEAGYHGPELYTRVPPMKKSPMEMVKEDRDYIVDHINEYIDRAKAKVKTGKYSVLSFK